jgi:hypothetical protein
LKTFLLDHPQVVPHFLDPLIYLLLPVLFMLIQRIVVLLDLISHHPDHLGLCFVTIALS